MSALIYPIHIQRAFERHWAARMVCSARRRSRPEGTEACVCGRIVVAPSSSNEVANYWECPACGRRWKTVAPSHGLNASGQQAGERTTHYDQLDR